MRTSLNVEWLPPPRINHRSPFLIYVGALRSPPQMGKSGSSKWKSRGGAGPRCSGPWGCRQGPWALWAPLGAMPFPASPVHVARPRCSLWVLFGQEAVP